MTTSGKLILLAIMVLVVVAGFFVRRHARKNRVTVWGVVREGVRRYHRPDLDAGPLTWTRVNLVYRHLMRSTFKKGPAGKVLPVRNIRLEVPEEDYQFVQQIGLSAFLAQLQDYRQRYAVENHLTSAGDSIATVTAQRSMSLRRLRPKAHFDAVSDGKTHLITAETRPEKTEYLGQQATEPFGGDTTEPNAAPARLTCDGQEWLLYAAESPYRMGRGSANEIRVGHPEVSAQHAIITYSGDSWVLEPLRTTNATKVGGKAVREPTALAPGAVITIGAFGPMVFDADGHA